jgi:hypothetical protein
LIRRSRAAHPSVQQRALVGWAGWALAAVATLTLSTCAGRTPPVGAPQPVLCHIDASLGIDKPLRDRTFPAQYWFVLLLQGYQSSGVIARPAKDCSGLPVKLETDGCQGDPQPSVDATTTLTPRDLVIAKVSDTQRLVWAITDRLSDGEAQGPMALAEIVQGGIEVRALGLLRAYPERVSLRLERLGTGTVVVAEGERCPDPQAPEKCDRAIRIVPRIGDRFIAKPVLSDSGACLGRAVVEVRGTGAGSGKKGAHYQIESVVTFGPEAVAIREQLAISAERAGGGSAKDSFVTRVQADRQLTFRGGSLVATGPSLLSRWQAQSGGASQ